MRAAAAAAAEAAELALLVEEGSSMLRDTGLRSRVISASRLEGDLDRRSERERRGSLLGSWSKRDLLRGCSDILAAVQYVNESPRNLTPVDLLSGMQAVKKKSNHLSRSQVAKDLNM